MKCFEITRDGRVLTGVSSKLWRVLDTEIIGANGYIYNADIEFIALPCMDGGPARAEQMLKNSRYAHLLCDTRLTAPQPASSRDEALIQIDLATHYFNPEFLDRSRPVAWKDTKCLLLCGDHRTAISSLAGDSLMVYVQGRISPIGDPAALQEIIRRDKFRKDLAAARENRPYSERLAEWAPAGAPDRPCPASSAGTPADPAPQP